MPTSPKPLKQSWRVQPPSQSSWSSYGKNTFNYQSKEWRSLRKQILTAHPLCIECERQGRVVLAKICDHIIPVQDYNGSPLDASNIQPLCKSCDDVKRGFEVQNRKREKKP
jgi:5-methylcytosine-specific restriction enzyme A